MAHAKNEHACGSGSTAGFHKQDDVVDDACYVWILYPFASVGFAALLAFVEHNRRGHSIFCYWMGWSGAIPEST